MLISTTILIILMSIVTYKIHKKVTKNRLLKEKKYNRMLKEPYLKRFETKRNKLSPPDFEYIARA
jgi:hypothetical protein